MTRNFDIDVSWDNFFISNYNGEENDMSYKDLRELIFETLGFIFITNKDFEDKFAYSGRYLYDGEGRFIANSDDQDQYLMFEEELADRGQDFLIRESEFFDCIHDIGHFYEAIDPENISFNRGHYPDIYIQDFNFVDRRDGGMCEEQMLREIRTVAYQEKIFLKLFNHKTALEQTSQTLLLLQDECLRERLSVNVIAEYLNFIQKASFYKDPDYFQSLINKGKEFMIETHGENYTIDN